MDEDDLSKETIKKINCSTFNEEIFSKLERLSHYDPVYWQKLITFLTNMQKDFKKYFNKNGFIYYKGLLYIFHS